MMRTILKSDQKNLTITLPDNLVGKQIEVIIFEIDEKKLKPSQMRGFLSAKSAGLMRKHIDQSRSDWNTL